MVTRRFGSRDFRVPGAHGSRGRGRFGEGNEVKVKSSKSPPSEVVDQELRGVKNRRRVLETQMKGNKATQTPFNREKLANLISQIDDLTARRDELRMAEDEAFMQLNPHARLKKKGDKKLSPSLKVLHNDLEGRQERLGELALNLHGKIGKEHNEILDRMGRLRLEISEIQAEIKKKQKEQK
ncbi:MAG: hypothetical protein ABID38_07295 [Candidatus Diapherotrites archaeon]